MSSSKSPRPGFSDHTGKNALEWSVFTLSSILVIGVFGWLIYSASRMTDPEARLAATAGQPVEKDGWYQVPVKVTNHGGLTASGVEVIVSAMIDGKEEDASFTLDFVPKGGSRQGAVTFKTGRPPQNSAPKIIGFSEP